MGKHFARMNAEKRLFDAGKIESKKEIITYEEHLKEVCDYALCLKFK